MLTVAELRMRTVQELTVIARAYQIQGWHALRKEGLVQAILGVEKARNFSATHTESAADIETPKKETSVRRQSKNHGDHAHKSKDDGSMKKKKDSSPVFFDETSGETLSDHSDRRVTSNTARHGASKRGATTSKTDETTPSVTRRGRKSSAIPSAVNAVGSSATTVNMANTSDVTASVEKRTETHVVAANVAKVESVEDVPVESRSDTNSVPQDKLAAPNITVRLRHFSATDSGSEKTRTESNTSKKRRRSECSRDAMAKSAKSAESSDLRKTNSVRANVSEASSSASDTSSSKTSETNHMTSSRATVVPEVRERVISFGKKEDPDQVAPRKISGNSSADSAIKTRHDSSEKASKNVTSSSHEGKENEGVSTNTRPVRTASASEKQFHRLQARLSKTRDLAQATEDQELESDQLMLRAQGAFWLEASWAIRRCTMERARAALAHLWHDSRPVLRLSEIMGDGTTTTVRRIVRLVDIHGGVNHWYVNVDDPPRTYQMEIGYIDPENRFIGLAKSNLITTSPDAESPIPAASVRGRKAEEDELNTNGVGTFEDRLRKSLGPGLRQPFTWTPSRFLYGEGGEGSPGFHFEVDAALVVYGATDPGVRLTLRGEPVRIQAGGTFMIRFSLPNRRQVIPIVAQSVDGLEQRTVIIAVERNTKVMEPIICEPGEPNEL